MFFLSLLMILKPLNPLLLNIAGDSATYGKFEERQDIKYSFKIVKEWPV